MISIAAQLGIGSGLDTQALVANLTAASQAVRTRTLDGKASVNAARISGIGVLRAGVDGLIENFSAAMTRAVSGLEREDVTADFVAAANALLDAARDAAKAGSVGSPGGPLAGEAAVRELQSAIGRLPLASLSPASSLTLSDLGMSSDRYGRLSFDRVKFAAADGMATGPALTGLSNALKQIQTRFNASGSGLFVAVSARYDRVLAKIAIERDRLALSTQRLSDTLTKSFSTMDRQVAQLKAVQSYVEQQVAAWNAK